MHEETQAVAGSTASAVASVDGFNNNEKELEWKRFTNTT